VDFYAGDGFVEAYAELDEAECFEELLGLLDLL